MYKISSILAFKIAERCGSPVFSAPYHWNDSSDSSDSSDSKASNSVTSSWKIPEIDGKSKVSILDSERLSIGRTSNFISAGSSSTAILLADGRAREVVGLINIDWKSITCRLLQFFLLLSRELMVMLCHKDVIIPDVLLSNETSL